MASHTELIEDYYRAFMPEVPQGMLESHQEKIQKHARAKGIVVNI